MNAAVKPQPVAFDPMLLAALIGLVAIGTIMVGSASISFADQQTGEPFFFLLRHVGALGIGVAGMAFAAVVPSDVWYRLHWLPLVAALGLLVVVLVPGVGQTVNGATRWLPIGPIAFQASEPARLCLLLYLAGYAVRRADELGANLSGLIKPLAVVGAASVLLMAEPDFGATVVLAATSFAMLFVAGARLRDLLLTGGVSVAALAGLAASSQYRLDRILSFRNPFDAKYEYGDGFQLTQSLIAIGRGEWGGVGLGESVQKLFYLPEAHTDFVFAVLVEELGFIGASIVIGLFGIVVYRALKLGREALQSGMPFQGLVAVGIGAMLGIEAFVNMGVNSGLLPTKGLALPLISYGRTSTVVTLIAIGLLLRIHRELHGGQKRLVQRGYVR